MKIKISIILISLCVILGFGVFQFFYFSDKRLHIVFCSIGQGDAIYMRTPEGVDILIDAGPDNSVLECLGRHMPFWDKTIELAFATHPDADHIAGYTYVLSTYTVLSYNTSEKAADTGVYERIQAQLSEQNIPIKYLIQGDSYIISDAISLHTYWPTKEFIQHDFSKDTNPYSLVQMLNFNKFNLLTDGDIEFDTLNTLFSQGVEIDVFKLPHHGSKTGIDTNTFNLIHPTVSIISAGKDNRYGHPHSSVLDELKQHNLKYLETQNGDIEIITDGETWTINQ